MESDELTPSPRPKGHSSRISPRSKSHMSHRDYDARLDDHQQTYVLSPRVMQTLNKTMTESAGVVASPSEKIAFHGPRRPLLLSYPASPRKVGKTTFQQVNYRRSRSAASPRRRITITVPEDQEGKLGVRIASDLRSAELKEDQPAPKKLTQLSILARTPSKSDKLAKEKGFVLDGVAVSSIQSDFGKIQPKLGPAIPPYNSHFDGNAKRYFRYKGLGKTLSKTGQIRDRSESIQGKAIDRFHFVGYGHDYLFRRNMSGAGYSRDFVDGHSQFLSTIGPMNGYNGKFGYRRNTPPLRYCPSPFGTATWSSLY